MSTGRSVIVTRCLLALICVLWFIGCASVKPLGFAYVNADGSVDLARSRNVTSANVEKDPNTGLYGFRNLSFTPHNIQVTLAFDTHSITGDNRTGSRAFVGDCSFIEGQDQACVAINSDPDSPSTTDTDAFFVLFF